MTVAEGLMVTCILRPIRAIGTVGMMLIASSGTGIGALANAAADSCLSAPNSPAPSGEHWYYHIDRGTQRKCWYLRTQSTRQTDAQTPSEVAPARHPVATKPVSTKPVSTKPVFTRPPVISAGAPPQASAHAAIQPDVRSAEPQSAPKISARTDEFVPEKSQEVSSAPSNAHPSLQENAGQSRIAAPSRPTPAVTTVQAQSPITAPSDIQPANVKATDSRNAASTDQETWQTINSKITKLPGTPNFLALVLALGLIAGVGGDLWRLAAKLISPYRGRPHVNRTGSNRVTKRRQGDDGRRPVMSQGDQSRQGGNKGDQQLGWYEDQRKQKRYDDQQQSPTHLASAKDEWPPSANEKHASFTSNGKVPKSEDALARLSQQIDGLLRVPSVDENQSQQEWYEDQQQSLAHPGTANDEWSASANESPTSLTSNSKVLKSDDALARLSEEIDWLLQKPRLA